MALRHDNDIIMAEGTNQTFPVLTMVDGLPCKPYYKGAIRDCRGFHRGQRKLLVGEIFFLTQALSSIKTKKPIAVIYIGASPGNHIPVLTTFFTDLIFECYDPMPFIFNSTEKIRIHQEFFTDELAKKYSMAKDLTLLLISDVRSTDLAEPDDATVMKNQADQLRWCQIIKPIQAWLKFRIPFNTENYRYLAGVSHFQAWAPPESAEIRMLAKRKSTMEYHLMREYPVKYHEQVCCYINTQIRGKRNIIDGICQCYDCRLEQIVLKIYADKYDKSSDFISRIGEYFDDVLGDRHTKLRHERG